MIALKKSHKPAKQVLNMSLVHEKFSIQPSGQKWKRWRRSKELNKPQRGELKHKQDRDWEGMSAKN